MNIRDPRKIVAFLSLAVTHVAIYSIVCGIDLLGFGLPWKIVWTVSNAPWFLLGDLGAPVLAPPATLPAGAPAIVRVFAPLAIRPNALGAAACIAIWLLMYWVVASIIATALPATRSRGA